MRVALDRGAVHVGARIALVGVADDVLEVARRLRGEVPLEPCREARAAAAAKAGSLELVDDVGGLHLEERPLEPAVAVAGDVLVDVLGVDHAAVAQDHAELLLVELDVLDLHRFRGLGVLLIQEALDLAALHDLLGDDLLGVLGLDLDVEGLLGEDLYDRPLLAEAETTRLDDLDVVLYALRLRLALEGLVDLDALVRLAAGTGADEDEILVSHLFLRLTSS
jgi:GNAT superfamily N-acetyltransferase